MYFHVGFCSEIDRSRSIGWPAIVYGLTLILHTISNPLVFIRLLVFEYNLI